MCHVVLMIRPAREADYAAFCTLVGELGVDDPIPPLERWRADRMPTTLVADAGRITGYIDFYTLDDFGYVRNLVVAPDARNAGTGAALMQEAAATLRDRGFTQWALNVKADNAPAIHLYEKLGFRTVFRSTAFRITWDQTRALPAEPAIAVGVVARDGEALEAQFGLMKGRVAAMLGRAGRSVVQLHPPAPPPSARIDTSRTLGVAGFDPEFPGANLFRVVRPQLAGTLFAALRPHARHDHLMVLVEDDDALAALIEGTGAIVRHRILHMRGPVP